MKKRVYYLDVLRIFSILGVMMIHVSASDWYSQIVTSYAWRVFNIYDSLVRFCIGTFMMISGALFLNPNKNISIKSLYSKYILRILRIFIFWSTVYAFYDVLAYKNKHSPINLVSVRDILYNIGVGHYHLWFLYAIIGLYIITPFLRRIVEDHMVTKYFLITSFIIGLIIPTFFKIPLWEGRMFITKANTIMNRINLHFLSGYSFYFVAGHYIHNTKFTSNQKKWIYFLGSIATLITISGTKYLSIVMGRPIQTLYGYLTPNVALQSLAVFLFFKELFSGINLSERSIKIIELLSELSLGMYLVHDFFNMRFKLIGLTTTSFNPIISVPLLTFAIFIGSFVVTLIISKIPLLNRFIN